MATKSEFLDEIHKTVLRGETKASPEDIQRIRSVPWTNRDIGGNRSDTRDIFPDTLLEDLSGKFEIFVDRRDDFRERLDFAFTQYRNALETTMRSQATRDFPRQIAAIRDSASQLASLINTADPSVHHFFWAQSDLHALQYRDEIKNRSTYPFVNGEGEVERYSNLMVHGYLASWVAEVFSPNVLPEPAKIPRARKFNLPLRFWCDDVARWWKRETGQAPTYDEHNGEVTTPFYAFALELLQAFAPYDIADLKTEVRRLRNCQ